MSPIRTARPGTPAGLREDLAFAATRRLPELFKNRAADEQTYPSLARVVATIEQRLWDTDPTRALLVVMRRAIDRLPSGRARPDFSEQSTWREIARLLYFGSEVDASLHTYGEYRQRVKELTGYHWSASEKDLVRFTGEVRRHLADVLLQLEREAIEGRGRAEVIQPEPGQPQSSLIDRPEHLDRLQALVDAGHRVICVWGEPGTGKSTLAAQFSRRLAHGTATPVIRCAPLLEAATPEAELFQQDLAVALAAEGVDSTKFSKAMWFPQLCEQLAARPRSAALVLDNVETDELIAQVLRTRPQIPVIITMRQRPQHPEVACEALGDFTEPQAREFIKRQLPEADDEDAKALAHALGYRPLALEHAVRFVRESLDISVKTLVNALATNVTDTLSTVTPLDEAGRNLARLYELILTSLERHADACAVLDGFLAVVGGSGVGYREMVYLFMQSEAGGAHDRLHFRSGLRELERHGLVLEHQGNSTERPVAELAMHALTYRILRDLRGPKLLAVEPNYWDWVLAGGHQALPTDDTNAHEHAYLALLQWTMRVASGGLPPGWASLFCADDRTWIALMEADDGDPAGRYLVRYALQSNDMYKLDYRTGKWSGLEHDEGVQLYLLITIYYERVHYSLGNERSRLTDEEESDPDGGSRSAPPRLDNEVTPSDGYRHIIIEPLPLASYLNRDWYLWALCGKRFVLTDEQVGAACAECEAMRGNAERLRDIEAALRSRYFTGLDYKEPVASADLFIMRAKLRRELERLEEAASDLDRAYRFLLIAIDESDSDVLLLGQGLIREATRLPEPHRHLALRVYNFLLWRFTNRPERARLLFDRAKLLGQWGQTADALAGYQEVAAGVEAGQLDASGINLFDMWFEKEKAERTLGLTYDANASLRRAIVEAERERGESKLLVAVLVLSGAYLARTNPWHAREDLKRALRIARVLQPPDYGTMWRSLMYLSDAQLALGSPTLARMALEKALQIARTHAPQLVEETEQAIARVPGGE
jgi:tetratricopeptide (TPR) repeat protein